MHGELDNWQTRLAKHFTELHRHRSSEAPGHPIFALEHGLDMSEVQELATAVRAHATYSHPLRAHALPWIIYAAELGYRYAGDEYWQTFEQETPGWTVYGDRYWIRERFHSFQKEFGGAKPSGIWAEHFSIICWPITHAILPRDLQRQLARILYELRHLFSAELFESPSMLGEFIAKRNWNATSRFQNFTQDPQLVGQIAAALLLQGEFGSGSLIHPATLKRIGGDLDSERQGREWLVGARRSVKERAHIRGLTLVRPTPPSAVRRPEEARAEVAALGIEPRLVLRPTDQSGAIWTVWLEIPDLTHLLLKFPQTRAILTEARCVVAGAAGTPLARGRCLYGTQRVMLARWPRADEVLLQFEQTDPQLDFLLRTECLLRPGPTWLFKIESDGLAYESRSLKVRAPGRYIIVRTGDLLKSSSYIHSVSLACQEVHGSILELPHTLTADWETILQQLGLSQARTIEVWPAGLAAVTWDGEGHGEWFESERPCLAIRADHPIAALRVSMVPSTGNALHITSITHGEPVFVELSQLPVGLHTVRFSILDYPGKDVHAPGDLDVVLRIRETRPWSQGVNPNGPIQVHIEPVTPALEELWDGHVEITVQGPVGRQVTCKVSLFEKDTSDGALFTKHLPPIPFPVTPAVWRSHFETNFQKAREAPSAYDAARTCELEFTAGELGAFTVRCDRKFTPLRWGVLHKGREHMARLFDDSGDPNPPVIKQLAFETPCVEEPLAPAAGGQYVAPAAGGLYVAQRGNYVSGVIIPPTIRDLKALSCVPHIAPKANSTEAAVQILSVARLWSQARLSGDLLSALRRHDVMVALGRHIFRLLYGETWASAEVALGDGFIGIGNLERAVSKQYNGIAPAIWHERAALAKATQEERICQFAKLAATYLSFPANAGDPKWLAEFALRLASDPAEIEAWAGQHLRAGLAQLLGGLSTLARAARFLVLVINRHLDPHAPIGVLNAGWRWR